MKVSRRQFIQSCVGATCAISVGATVGTESALAAQNDEIPEYADWIDNDRFEDGGGVTCHDLQTAVEIAQFRLENMGQDIEPASLDPLALPYAFGSVAGSEIWSKLEVFGFSGAVLGATEISEDRSLQTQLNPEDVIARRHLLYRDVSVFLGPFDTDSFTAVVEENEDIEQSETDGIYTGVDQNALEYFFTWGEGYFIIAEDREPLEAVEQAGNGERPRRHEENDEFARLLRSAGHHEIVNAVQFQEGQNTFAEAEINVVDLSPYEDVTGYAVGNDVDFDGEEIDATVGLTYPSAGDISDDAIRTVGADATERDESRDDDYVRVSATFSGENWYYGNPFSETDNTASTPTPTPTPEVTPTPTPTPAETATSTPTATPEESTDTESSDGSGPGFGLLGGLAGLGGAGYLLKQRLNDTDE